MCGQRHESSLLQIICKSDVKKRTILKSRANTVATLLNAEKVPGLNH